MGGYLKNAFLNIIRKRFRSALTILGIGIGVLSVIVISAIGDLGKQTINNELSSIGMDGLAVSANTNLGNVSFSTQELGQVRSTQEVKEAMPLIMQATKSRCRSQVENCMAWGIDDHAQEIISLELLYGRMMGKSDVAAAGRVCMIDEVFAQKIAGQKNIAGKTIEVLLNGGYEEFQVIGVVKSGGNILQNLMGDYIPGFVYLPYSTVQKMSGRQSFDQIAVRLEEGANPDSAARAIAARLETENGVKDSIKVENLVQQKENFNQILDIITLVLSVIAGISLIVAGLSIMTVMLVSVSERTREIGIKKSIGASRWAILAEFLMEALLLSLIGAGIGCAAGLGLSFAGSAAVGVPFTVNQSLLLFSLGFAVLTGIIFGVYPALKASQLRPVDALRQE